MFRNLLAGIIIFAIFAGSALADSVILEYKSVANNISCYGYLNKGIVVDFLDVSTKSPYLMTGYTRKIGPVSGEILGGLVYNQTENYIGNVAIDLIAYGSYKGLFGLGCFEIAPKIKDDGWIFTKTIVNYKQFGILAMTFTPTDDDTIFQLGPTICWSWKNYGKLITEWIYNFSAKSGKFVWLYKKEIKF